MMTIDLGKRAVACKKWRWMPGMLVRCPGYQSRLDEDTFGWNIVVEGWLPDLSDPATLGCLLALVREAWSTAASPRPGLPGYDAGRIYVEPHAGGWHACWPNGTRLGSSRTENTEAGALVAALEAAP
jgi:hypothetical protein